MDGLIFPALGLAFLGWVVPRLLSLVWPEGVRPLMLLALVATVIMFLLGAGVFVALYLVSGVPLGELLALGAGSAVVHFGRLSLISALIWGPVLVLSVAGLPRHWTRATW